MGRHSICTNTATADLPWLSFTAPLFGDPKSDVIRAFGILNTLIDPTDKPWYGIPYPGTYVINSEGSIVHKFFDNNLAVRAGPEQLLRAVQGQPLHSSTALEQTSTAVQINVTLDGDALVATVQRDLVIRFQIPTGRHVYATPAPQGSVAVDVLLDENEHLVLRPLVRPTSETHRLAGTRADFKVHDGEFELRLPLTVPSRAKGNAAEIRVADSGFTAGCAGQQKRGRSRTECHGTLQTDVGTPR